MAAKKFKFDIFIILGRISKKQRNFSEDEMKTMAPVVLTRWLSGSKSEREIFLVNQLANLYCFRIPDHKQLLINLMTISSSGRYTRYQWIKRTAKVSKTKICEKVIAEYYNYPLRHAKDVMIILDDDTIIGYAEEMGYQKDQMKDLRKELKTR